MSAILNTVLEKTRSRVNPETLNETIANVMINLLTGLLVFLTFYVAWMMIARLLKWVLSYSKLDQTAVVFIETSAKYVVLTIGVINSLSAVGVDTAAALTSLGIVGITVGFAAKDSLSNLISSVIIFLDRPFVIGDLVEIDGKYGRVDQITLRSTRIITNDGKMLAVPNSEVINKTVASYTNFPNLRIDISFTIDISQSVDQVREILVRLIEEDSDYLTDPPPQVVVSEFKDCRVELTLQAWLRDEREHIRKRFELQEHMMDVLKSIA